MNTNRNNILTVLLILITLVLASCAAPATETQEPMDAAPTELKIAAIFATGPENDWDGTLIEAIARAQDKSPHDLVIHDLAYTEGVFGDDADRAMREYAEAGYDIIWGHHSGAGDNITNLMDEFPNTMFVGSGYLLPGGNTYSVDKQVHEPAYLCGVIAGRMTESNKIGAVGPFPVASVNAEIHAFFDGARSVNPDIEVSVTFVESWFDPAKSNEATLAQVNAGVDQIFMRADAFDACEETGIMCYGPLTDQTALAPHSVVTNALGFWDPEVEYVIDIWYQHKSTGEPFDAPADYLWWAKLADGGSELGPINENLVRPIPQTVLEEVENLRQQILDGSLIIEGKYDEQPVSD